jgi:hypothetical protein
MNLGIVFKSFKFGLFLELSKEPVSDIAKHLEASINNLTSVKNELKS